MKYDAPEIVDEIAVRMELVNACALAGGQETFAAQHHISPEFLDAIIHGRKSVPVHLANSIGYVQVTRYQKSVVHSSPSALGRSSTGNSPADVGAFSSS